MKREMRPISFSHGMEFNIWINGRAHIDLSALREVLNMKSRDKNPSSNIRYSLHEILQFGLNRE